MVQLANLEPGANINFGAPPWEETLNLAPPPLGGERMAPGAIAPSAPALQRHCVSDTLFITTPGIRLCSTTSVCYSLQHNIELVNKLDCVVTHAEVDIILCSYMLKPVADSTQTL